MRQLTPQIHAAFDRWEKEGGATRGVRLAVAVDPVDPFRWLAHQTVSRQSLWSCRREQDVRVGLSAAQVLRGQGLGHADEMFAAARGTLRRFDSTEVRYVGGFAFQDRAEEEEPWPALGRSQFWIPRFELVRVGERYEFACNLLFDPQNRLRREDVLEELARVVWDDRPVRLSAIESRNDVPDHAGWCRSVNTALDHMQEGRLDKVVLARKAVYSFEAEERAGRILAVLGEVTSTCYHFLVQPNEQVAFMGTPPECLFRRDGRQIRTEALAGTRPRVGDTDTDRALGQELLGSEKEQNEHGIVRKSLLQKLDLLCTEVSIDPEASLLILERKQHLISRIQGRLQEGVHDADLLQALHPTPAVGGFPKANALKEIQNLEPFRRGWYAAPVGWFDLQSTEFAVAIRSGLVHGKTVLVYSGAGIVPGSKAEAEWEEIENKISDFVKVTQRP